MASSLSRLLPGVSGNELTFGDGALERLLQSGGMAAARSDAQEVNDDAGDGGSDEDQNSQDISDGHDGGVGGHRDHVIAAGEKQHQHKHEHGASESGLERLFPCAAQNVMGT